MVPGKKLKLAILLIVATLTMVFVVQESKAGFGKASNCSEVHNIAKSTVSVLCSANPEICNRLVQYANEMVAWCNANVSICYQRRQQYAPTDYYSMFVSLTNESSSGPQWFAKCLY